MKIKFIIIGAIISVLLYGYFVVSDFIGEDNSYSQSSKPLIPGESKPGEPKIVSKERLLPLKFQKKQLADIPRSPEYIPLTQDNKKYYFDLHNKKIVLKKWHLDSASKYLWGKYLGYSSGNLLTAKSNGTFSYVNIKKLENNKLKLTVIKSNLSDIIEHDSFVNKHDMPYDVPKFMIRDLLVHNGKIYMSHLNEAEEKCFNISILVSGFSLTYLEFEPFFVPSTCVKTNNSYGEFNPGQSGEEW